MKKMLLATIIAISAAAGLSHAQQTTTKESPGVIVPMTGQTSVVEFDLVKAD